MRRSRRAALVAAGCGLLLVPPAAMALQGVGPWAPAGAPATSASAVRSVTTGKVRVVTPGERVGVAPGVKIWLTSDGMHWTGSHGPARFRSAMDGAIAEHRPDVEWQTVGRDGQRFVFGTYRGGGEAARVEIETSHGDVDGVVLTLAGSPGWGAWFAATKLPDTVKTPRTLSDDHAVRGVTVYDAAGVVIASRRSAR
ncbi:hypothetical protein AB0O68_04900 [Streptomyces sp. NPDC087512]|uniref:hypothetical protein n=1 Tax=Streptomyces sp. NPDC087512 TaxID=3155059 RepID=UPI00342E8E99